MDEVDHLLQIYRSSLSNKVRELTEPLKTHFGIDEFVYTWVKHDGLYVSISNQPGPSEYWYSHRFYESTLLVRNPENFNNEIFLPNRMPGEKQAEEMDANFGFCADNLLAILRKEKKDLHYFLFNTSKKEKSLIPFYLNNLKILECFCDYFLKEWSPYLREMEKYTINMAKLLGSKFWSNPTPDWSLTYGKFEDKLAFLKKINYLSNDFCLPKLSRQEKQCLNYLYQGKTISDTAELMNISPRTAEFYFVNIKNKLNLNTKSEMIDAVHKLKLLAIL